MDFVRDQSVTCLYSGYSVTYKTFRCLFNKRTCLDLAGIEIIAPEEKMHFWTCANISRTDFDDRLISMINFSIVEKEYPRGEKGIKATVYLAEKQEVKYEGYSI